MSELDRQYGLNQGPELLGRSYREMANRVEAAWQLAMDQNIANPVLGLIARTMNVATSSDGAALLTRLDYLIERAVEWRDELSPTRHTYDDGAGGIWEHPGRRADCTQTECSESPMGELVRLRAEWPLDAPDAGKDRGEEMIENPFEEKPFIDRLIELIAGNEHSARTTDEESTADELRTDVTELLGDRDDLADKITTEVEKLHPLCDGDEVNRGIYVALDFLFGAGPGTALPEPTTHLAAPGVIHSGDLSDCVKSDCVAYRTKQDTMRPEPTWSGEVRS